MFRKISTNRLTKVFTVPLLALFVASCATDTKKDSKENGSSPMDTAWKQAENIISTVKAPTFKDKVYNITDFGGVADGTTKNTEAFKKAIETCHTEGGGTVLVPEGTFLTGAIHLKSNVNLHLNKGAEVLFSKDTLDYLPMVHTSYEGVELMNYSPLIYAKGAKNIGVTGEGTFNGQADNTIWWPWCGAGHYGYAEGTPAQRAPHNLPRLRTMNENNTPVEERTFGPGHQLRPLFFQVLECENVIVQGVTFTNAPFWVIHPLKSQNILVDGVTVNSHGPNNDGCDPEYCKNVVIQNCTFNTGDDCIAIKSGRNNDGRRVNIPSENIVVQNCTMADGHGGVVMGSEISAGVRNVYVRDCKMDSPNLDRAIRIKTNTLRGGFVEGVYVKDLEVGQVKEAVLKINTFYGIYENQEGEFMPTIKDIYLQNVAVKNGGKYGILIKGRPQAPAKNITLENVTIEKAQNVTSIENAENITYINTHINQQLMK